MEVTSLLTTGLGLVVLSPELCLWTSGEVACLFWTTGSTSWSRRGLVRGLGARSGEVGGLASGSTKTSCCFKVCDDDAAGAVELSPLHPPVPPLVRPSSSVSSSSFCQLHHTLVKYGIPRKEGNVLFNNALNTFYLWLYGVRHMVKDHSDSERGNPLPPHRLLFPISSKGFFICIIPQTG